MSGQPFAKCFLAGTFPESKPGIFFVKAGKGFGEIAIDFICSTDYGKYDLFFYFGHALLEQKRGFLSLKTKKFP